VGGSPITALGVMRNLGRNQVKVYCVAEEKNEIAFSKYCKKFFVAPHVERDKTVLKTLLLAIEREIHGRSVLFAGSDMAAINLSESKAELPEKYLFFSNPKAIKTLVNKKNFYHSLDQCNVPHPITYFLENCEDVEKISEQLEYPVYIKPALSQIFSERFQRKGFVVWSKEELVKSWILTSRYNIEVMIQEIIPGPAENMFGICGYFDKSCNPCAFFAYRRIREWPHQFGNSSLMESISISDVPSLKEITEKYLTKLRYSGLFDAEFKKDQRDGSFKLIEINARSWWQNSFPTKCGINLVFMSYLDALDKRIDCIDTYKAGVKWLFVLNDMRSSLKMLREGRINISEWASSFRRVRDYAYFSTDDRRPCLMKLWFLLSYFSQLVRTKM